MCAMPTISRSSGSALAALSGKILVVGDGSELRKAERGWSPSYTLQPSFLLRPKYPSAPNNLPKHTEPYISARACVQTECLV